MKNNNIKMSSNKNFGIVFFIFFFIISIYPLLNDGNIRLWFLFFSIIFLTLGLLNSKILNPLNKLWFKFGIFLGRIISPIIMGIIFFFVVTLIGYLMRLFKKDMLGLKFNDNKTYWIKKTGPKSEMKNQF
ncbi:SxtJ family membrane protein [Candidatus Pelagibacter sp.]|nr:SxtJ family membrane protein [Candidatus Pelagibacter sp.]